MKFLIDENLSPKIAHHLRTLGYVAACVRDEGLKGKTDEEICEWAKKENVVVISRDLDFGFLYRQIIAGGTIILRSKDDSTQSSIKIIDRLHIHGFLSQENLLSQLTVATEKKVRIFKNPTLTN